MVATIIGGNGLRQHNHGAGAKRRVLATDEDVCRANHIDAITGTATFHYDCKTTLSRWKSRYLNLGTNEISS